MPRISFRLRPDDGGVLRGHESGAPDDFDGLKSTDIQLAPADTLTDVDLFLDATSTCYGEVDVTWSIPIEEIGATIPTITQSIVVYSKYGPPETISSGRIVAQEPPEPGGDVPEDYTRFVAPVVTDMPEGQFAYFSLFVLYQSIAGDEYYEKVADISEIVPQNFGSTQSMWDRIPDFYQGQDSLIGTPTTAQEDLCLGIESHGEPVGPLLRYLSVFGFEMDRERSVLQHITRSKNPEYADSESIDALGFEMGTVLSSADLGVGRMRTLLHDIGTFRKIKGTVAGTEFFVRSLSGSTASVDTVGRVISVNSQRVNHCLDPQNTGNLVVTTRDAAVDEAERPGPSAGSDQYPPAYDGYEFTDTPAAGGGTVHHMVSPVSVEAGDQILFSVHGDFGNDLLKWARTVDSTTGAIYDFCVVDPDPLSDDNSVPHPVVYGNRTYFSIPVTEMAMGATSATVNIEFMTEAGAFDDRKFLLEKNSVGDYFDGHTVLGGWLTGISTSISDYRWEGADDNSRSLYNEDYERTKEVINGLFQEVLPVDVADEYTIVFNVV